MANIGKKEKRRRLQARSYHSKQRSLLLLKRYFRYGDLEDPVVTAEKWQGIVKPRKD